MDLKPVRSSKMTLDEADETIDVFDQLTQECDALRLDNQRLRAALKFAVRKHISSCSCRACEVYWSGPDGVDKRLA